MRFKLLNFRIYGKDGFTFIYYRILKNDEVLEFDEQLKIENPEDLEIMCHIESFINKKVVI